MVCKLEETNHPLEVVEVQEKNEAHLLLLFFIQSCFDELSSLENIWVHGNVEFFEPILHIYQCLAGWKKQIMY